jgi:hypothetical protein
MKRLTLEYQGKTYPATETQKELKRVARLWRRNAQSYLRRHNKNTTGALKSSMKTRFGQSGNSVWADITPTVDYWEFVDLGVRGAKSSPFKRQRESPYKYKKKKPPLNVIEKWLKDKGAKPRNTATGQYVTRRSFAFLVQNAIWSRGLKPTFFITDTGKRLEKKYALSIAGAYANDLADAMEDYWRSKGM